MAVQTVGTDIQLAISKPFDLEIIFVEAGVFNFGKWLDPVKALGLLGPKLIRFFNRALIAFEIFSLGGPCGFFKFCWYRIDLFHYLLP